MKIDREINQISSSLSPEIDPTLKLLLDWWIDQEDLARECADKALQNFENLKQQVEERDYLDRFHLEIKSYLELIHYSLSKNNKIYLETSPLRPTLCDRNSYEFADPNVYRKTVEFVRKNIPGGIDFPSERTARSAS